MLWLLLDCYCCRFYGRLVYVASSEAARWRYARLYMRQNGYHMCISRFVHCLSIVSVSLWCYWNVIGAVLCFVRQQMLWPTNTISLIYCNGFKLCERQTALFYCTHTHSHISHCIAIIFHYQDPSSNKNQSQFIFKFIDENRLSSASGETQSTQF